MKNIFLPLLVLMFSFSSLARDCVVFSLGGMADRPHELPEESRHITRMNFVYDQAKDLGCKVFKAHNKSYTDLMKEMKEFVKKEGITRDYKFHFSFSDHGSSSKIPLKSGDYVTSEKFFKGVSDFVPKESHVTYATHICWGGNLMDASVSNDIGLNICGGSSVDKDNLSNAWNNPAKKKNETDADYKKRKYKTRKKEYLGAGWVKATSMNPTVAGHRLFDYDVSMVDYHYAAMKKDTTNAIRGGSLSSTLFAREQLTEVEDDPFYYINNAIELSPDLDNLVVSGPSLLSQVKGKGKGATCSVNKDPFTFSDEPLRELTLGISDVIDTNKNWLNQNTAKYPFLKKYKTLLDTERAKTSKYDLIKTLSDANELFKSGSKKLKPLYDLSYNSEKIDALEKQLIVDQKNLTGSQFKKKYLSKFGDMAADMYTYDFKEEPEWNNYEISGAIQNKIYDDWEVYQKKIKDKIKPIVARIRMENDIDMMRKFLQSKNISQSKKDQFKRMANCEAQSFI